MNRELENELLDRAVKGDDTAFSDIYFLLRDSIYGFAYRMTEKRSIAEDITQDVFMFLIENPEKYYSDRGSLSSFLCGVARNKILNHLKKSSTKFEGDWLAENELNNRPNEKEISPLKVLLRKEFSEKVLEGISELSHFQKEAILLREMQELSYAEIAKITETDLSTVKARLFRARKNLALRLAPYLKANEEKYYEVQ